jgi:DNA-binding Lrp family transcriptional regulator
MRKKKMWLTNNEKKALKLLLENSRLSDTTIATKLNITSQAVGRIRKKLEDNLIRGYKLDLDLNKLGIKVFVMCKLKITSDGYDIGRQNIGERLSKIKNIICIMDLIGEEFNFMIIGGFKDMKGVNDFFHSSKNQKEIFKYVECGETRTLDPTCIIKNDPTDLINLAIDELGGSEDPRINKNKIF